MKKLLAAVTALILTLPTFATAADWIVFTPTGGRSSIMFPVQPVEKKRDVSTEHGPYYVVAYTARNEGQAYMYGWVDYDPKFKFDIQAELNANRDNFVKGMNAKLLKTTRISHGKHPGIEFTAENDKTFFRSRVYIVGRRPYQLVVAVPKGEERSPNINKFLTSFKLK